MRVYVTDSGEAVDLDHVLSVSPTEHQSFVTTAPFGYLLTLAFNSSRRIGHGTEELAIECRSKLIAAWSSTEVRRPASPQSLSAAPATVPQPVSIEEQIYPGAQLHQDVSAFSEQVPETQSVSAMMASDDSEVQRLLREHEAAMQGRPSAEPPPTSALDNSGGYSSPFL